jgi:divalent metal cation (Fe/Co/Zn/Cd) transporter
VLTDAACINPVEIQEVTHGIEGVMGSHNIRTRGKEDHVSIDMHIFVDHEIKIRHAHQIAHSVERALKKEFPAVKDIVIHVEPYQNKGAR